MDKTKTTLNSVSTTKSSTGNQKTKQEKFSVIYVLSMHVQCILFYFLSNIQACSHLFLSKCGVEVDEKVAQEIINMVTSIAPPVPQSAAHWLQFGLNVEDIHKMWHQGRVLRTLSHILRRLHTFGLHIDDVLSVSLTGQDERVPSLSVQGLEKTVTPNVDLSWKVTAMKELFFNLSLWDCLKVDDALTIPITRSSHLDW